MRDSPGQVRFVRLMVVVGISVSANTEGLCFIESIEYS